MPNNGDQNASSSGIPTSPPSLSCSKTRLQSSIVGGGVRDRHPRHRAAVTGRIVARQQRVAIGKGQRGVHHHVRIEALGHLLPRRHVAEPHDLQLAAEDLLVSSHRLPTVVAEEAICVQ